MLACPCLLGNNYDGHAIELVKELSADTWIKDIYIYIYIYIYAMRLLFSHREEQNYGMCGQTNRRNRRSCQVKEARLRKANVQCFHLSCVDSGNPGSRREGI
jgi:hypothetical protein